MISFKSPTRIGLSYGVDRRVEEAMQRLDRDVRAVTDLPRAGPGDDNLLEQEEMFWSTSVKSGAFSEGWHDVPIQETTSVYTHRGLLAMYGTGLTVTGRVVCHYEPVVDKPSLLKIGFTLHDPGVKPETHIESMRTRSTALF